MKKTPLWKRLVDEGFFADRKTAESWIMAGKVIVGDQRAESAGELVPLTAAIRVKGLDLKYVGKGGLKLEGALADFGVDVAGKVVLDTGASTGGFTDCLLQHGAAKVYAIDAGYGQLAGKLRADPRVVNMERTNIGDVASDALQPKPVLATIDLSYLSLKKAIPMIVPLLDRQAEMICLVKPLFEVADSEIRRKGVIEDPDMFRDVLHDLIDFVKASGFACLGVTHSHVTGNAGTREFFLRVSLRDEPAPEHLEAAIDRAIEAALQLEAYVK